LLPHPKQPLLWTLISSLSAQMITIITKTITVCYLSCVQQNAVISYFEMHFPCRDLMACFFLMLISCNWFNGFSLWNMALFHIAKHRAITWLITREQTIYGHCCRHVLSLSRISFLHIIVFTTVFQYIGFTSFFFFFFFPQHIQRSTSWAWSVRCRFRSLASSRSARANTWHQPVSLIFCT
jgi:hypothetical protein